MSKGFSELYEFGKFRLDVGEHKLVRIGGSEKGSLPEKAFQTLVYLVRNSGTLVSKDELIAAVWQDTVVEENNLGKAVHAIRQFLGEKAGRQKYIETVPKHGYRFVADVRRLDEEDTFDSDRPTLSDPPPEIPASITVAREVSAPENSPQSTRHTGRSRRASFFQPTVLRSGLIGLVLLGSIGIVGWFENINRRQNDVSLTSSAKNGLLEHGRSPAYDLYVRGKVKVASENREDTEAAIRLLEEAVSTDPNLAEAYAQLARGYNTMAFKYSSDAERKGFHENAEVAIEKALALNPNLAEGHLARGLILWTNTEGFPHEMAIQSFRRSIALAPDLDEAHHQLSLVYSHIGLLDQAQRSIKRALEVNPNNTLARFRAGVYTAYGGNFEDAISVYKTIPRDVTPLLVDRSIAEALIQTGRTAEAEVIVDDYLRRFPQDEGGSFWSVKALLLAKKGQTADVEDAIIRATETGRGFGHFHHSAYNIASAYAALNKTSAAVKWLKDASENGFPNYPYFDKDPNLDRIRKDDEFIRFMEWLRPRWERFADL